MSNILLASSKALVWFADAIISQHTARSLEDCLESIEESTGYYQVLLILHADFGISLFVSVETISLVQLRELFKI